MIMGNEVLTPCPISGFFAMIVTMPSGETLIKALGVSAAGETACPKIEDFIYRLSRIPPPLIAVTRRKERRLMTVVAISVSYSPSNEFWAVCLVDPFTRVKPIAAAL